MNQDNYYLELALELAKIRRGFCAPNPSVGAVIVNHHNEIIATGYHQGPGSDHAEVDALKKINFKAENATIYVTLEPCCHTGRTPPCTDALIKSKIKKVIYGYGDPNPIVSGKGENALTAAGIECYSIQHPKIRQFYQSYHHWHKTKMPFVTAKIAMSMDGMIAKENGSPIQLTGAVLNEFTHLNRKNSDAIFTTAKTIIADDPQLNARYQQEIIAKPIYILDTHLAIQPSAKIFTTAKSITIFHAKKNHGRKIPSVKYVEVNHDSQGLILLDVLAHIGADGIHDLWMEAGGKSFSAMLQQDLINRGLIYLAPVYLKSGLPGIHPAFSLKDNYQISWQQMGVDVYCEFLKQE